MHADQVGGQAGHAGRVVHRHHVQPGFVRTAAMATTGIRLASARSGPGGQHLLRDEQAVHLAGQRPDPALELLARAGRT